MDLYEAEEILEKKWFASENKYKYRIKWLGYNIKESTWVFEDSKITDILIKKFENKKNKALEKELIEAKETKKLESGDITKDIPSKILGLKRTKNEMLCLVEWELKDKVCRNNSIIKYELLRRKYPFLLLDFYEKRVKFLYQSFIFFKFNVNDFNIHFLFS